MVGVEVSEDAHPQGIDVTIDTCENGRAPQ